MPIQWEKLDIDTQDGTHEGIAPIIISASRSTDIPAFYGQWLTNRLRAGYVKWKNPFNSNQQQYISFQNTRLFVFWTKNPKNFIDKLEIFDEEGINYYFQFTLNDYDAENYEPNLPPLKERVETFKMLSQKIGKEKVIWRFDPLILTNSLGVKELLEKIEKVGEQIKEYTEKCVFSFVDLEYRKVMNNLKRLNIHYKEFDIDKMHQIAEGIVQLQESLNVPFSTCSEKIDLDRYDISHNSCVDRHLIIKLFQKDNDLMDFVGYKKSLFGEENSEEKIFNKYKDKGQRKECGCIMSKDIGKYDTCPHLCVYCYANSTSTLVNKNYTGHNDGQQSIV